MSLLRPIAGSQSGTQGEITQTFLGSFSAERPGWIRTDLSVDRGKREKFTNSRYREDFHGGIDYSAASGSQLFAVHDGVIIDQGRYYYTGECYVILRIKRNLTHQLVVLYTHMTPGSFRFRIGDRVSKGQVIGLSGNSGWSSGPHLHFELRRGPRYTRATFTNSYKWMRYDPQPFINGRALSTIL